MKAQALCRAGLEFKKGIFAGHKRQKVSLFIGAVFVALHIDIQISRGEVTPFEGRGI
jgi:hypothetical protein